MIANNGVTRVYGTTRPRGEESIGSGGHSMTPCNRCGRSVQLGKKSRENTMCRDCRGVDRYFCEPKVEASNCE